MCIRSARLRSFITLLLALSLAIGTPVSMSMEVCDRDNSSASVPADNSKHNCCHEQERYSDHCQSNNCDCQTVTGGALASASIIADDLMVAVIPTLSSRELVSTIHDLPKRPPRHA